VDGRPACPTDNRPKPIGPVTEFSLEGFSPRKQARLEALVADLDFVDARDRRSQIAVACKHLREFDTYSRFTFREIGRFFGGLKGQIIGAQWAQSRHEAKASGRPPILSPEVRQWMVKLVTRRVQEDRAITYAELLDRLQSSHEIVISGDTLRHVVRNMSQIKSIIGVPMESERVDVDPAALTAWFDELEAKIEGIPRQFIFNIDEAGSSEHGDKQEVKVLVPLDYPDPSIPVPFDRHSKRSMLTACIAADGYRMKPFIIVDRVTAEAELRIYGYDRKNVCFASQENAFMTKRLFDLWAQEVFFPAIEERRREFGYDGRVLVLMDRLGSHQTPAFLEQCTGRRIEVLFLFPHSSDETQHLDLLTFALLNQRFAASKFDRLSTWQSNPVVRILGAWFSASAPHHNVEAFMSLGLIPVKRSGQFFLALHRDQARRVRRWSVHPVDFEEAPPADTEPAPSPAISLRVRPAFGQAFIPRSRRSLRRARRRLHLGGGME
jgi:hypothetical protein